MTKNINAILMRIATIKAKTSNDILNFFLPICQLGVLQDRQATKPNTTGSPTINKHNPGDHPGTVILFYYRYFNYFIKEVVT